MLVGMSTSAHFTGWFLATTFSVLAAIRCNGGISENSDDAAAEPGARTEAPAKSEEPEKASKNAAPIKKAQLGKGVWLETEGKRRRVLVAAEVCLREGSFGLECLLCKKNTKEHESILTTEADARAIHLGLLAAGAEPGSPVKYVEKGDKYITVPPSGSRIKVTLRYDKEGKGVVVPAQEWVRQGKTKHHLKGEWVFAGSLEYPHPEDKKKKIYAANSDGAYICVLNVTSAMLDLPTDNPNRPPEEREFQPYTDRIPPLETKVTLILEPLAGEKKPAKK